MLYTTCHRSRVQISFAFALFWKFKIYGTASDCWPFLDEDFHLKACKAYHHRLCFDRSAAPLEYAEGLDLLHNLFRDIPHSNHSTSLSHMQPDETYSRALLAEGAQWLPVLTAMSVHAGQIHAGQLLAGQAAQHHWAGAWPDQRCSAWAPGVGGAHH